MRDYRGRSGITLRSRRRVSRARTVGVGLLVIGLVVGVLLWWPQTGSKTDTTRADEQVAQPSVKGAIPLRIPGQTKPAEPGDSE